MEIRNTPSRYQIFSKETQNLAKKEKNRHFHRKFLSLPLVANNNVESRKSATQKVTKDLNKSNMDRNGGSLVKSQTSPEIHSSKKQLDAQDAEDESVIFGQTKAIVHVFDDRTYPKSETELEIESHKYLNSSDKVERHSDTDNLIQKRDVFKKSAEQSGSLDSDVVVGVFEGKDTSDEEVIPKIKVKHVDLSVPRNDIFIPLPDTDIKQGGEKAIDSQLDKWRPEEKTPKDDKRYHKSEITKYWFG